MSTHLVTKCDACGATLDNGRRHLSFRVKHHDVDLCVGCSTSMTALEFYERFSPPAGRISDHADD